MAAYPAEYDFHVVLRDGGLARIRPVTSQDADQMRGMFRRMGRESIYHRFFSHKQDISDEEIEYFTTVDYDDRMAFVAEIKCPSTSRAATAGTEVTVFLIILIPSLWQDVTCYVDFRVTAPGSLAPRFDRPTFVELRIRRPSQPFDPIGF